ncbi:MAG: hypothetical protein IKE64_08415 [Thermoguttaceae bacterium]|nr:hypothetical protein [Thermoguttaceae bacterium]
MADYLQSGLAWLSGALRRCASSTVIYRRGEMSRSVSAVYGRTRYQWLETSGLRTGSFVSDFLIEYSELGLIPKAGDRITAGGRLFEVLPFGADGCWRWSDPFGLRMRIHTKQIGALGP